MADTIAMVLPTDFAGNDEARQDNRFMKTVEASENDNVRNAVLSEFLSAHRTLVAAGVRALVFPSPGKSVGVRCPDAIFPNNWFSTHIVDGKPRLFLFPMKCHNRRPERDSEIVRFLTKCPPADAQASVDIVDLTHREQENVFLEGTGSMVMDHQARLVYACISERTHTNLAEEFASHIGYKCVFFDAYDANGVPVYHTNVMCAVGSRAVVFCLESIRDLQQRSAVEESVRASGKVLVDISLEQMANFCGNVLEVKTVHGHSVWCMSTRAYQNFLPHQREHLGQVVHADISTIETVGGGGMRCMMAELYFS